MNDLKTLLIQIGPIRTAVAAVLAIFSVSSLYVAGFLLNLPRSFEVLFDSYALSALLLKLALAFAVSGLFGRLLPYFINNLLILGRILVTFFPVRSHRGSRRWIGYRLGRASRFVRRHNLLLGITSSSLLFSMALFGLTLSLVFLLIVGLIILSFYSAFYMMSFRMSPALLLRLAAVSKPSGVSRWRWRNFLIVFWSTSILVVSLLAGRLSYYATNHNRVSVSIGDEVVEAAVVFLNASGAIVSTNTSERERVFFLITGPSKRSFHFIPYEELQRYASIDDVARP